MEWKLWEGQVIDGRFPLRQYLGGSAHSGVFLTEYGQESPRATVIKLVSADSGKAEAWMLRRELAAGLSHPGLVSLFHFGTCQIEGTGLVYVVMERADEDLSQVIPTRPLAPAEVREMLPPVLETLAYIHSEGFAHGRLTPTNIMAASDRVKVSSDGLLRIGESSDDLWEPSPNGPPESRTGVTPGGDVWSLGMTLVEALTQHAPAWDPAGTGDPVVPEHLEAPFLDIARRCLRLDPRLRCSLDEIVRALQPAVPSPQARPIEAKAIPAAKAVTKRPYLVPAAVGTILGVLICTGLILTHALSSSAETGSPHPTASEPAAVQEIPQAAAAAQGAKEVAAPPDDKTPEASSPVPTLAASVPATDNSAEKAAPAVADKPAAGDVVDRLLPDVPPQILGTIRGKVTVRVRVKVDPAGAVVDAELNSQPGSKYFDKMALDAARRWKFKPASDTGNGAGSARMLRFEFRTDGCEASSGPAQP